MATRQIAVAAILIAAHVSSISAVHAEFKTVTIKHIGYDELKKKCDAAGGAFDSAGKTDYWCQGKDGGTVVCDTKQCTGGYHTADGPKSPSRQHLGDPLTATEMLPAN